MCKRTILFGVSRDLIPRQKRLGKGRTSSQAERVDCNKRGSKCQLDVRRLFLVWLYKRRRLFACYKKTVFVFQKTQTRCLSGFLTQMQRLAICVRSINTPPNRLAPRKKYKLWSTNLCFFFLKPQHWKCPLLERTRGIIKLLPPKLHPIDCITLRHFDCFPVRLYTIRRCIKRLYQKVTILLN